jgi:CelD/BcsL family acetyltransferase involved in cellulose biosynthesis
MDQGGASAIAARAPVDTSRAGPAASAVTTDIHTDLGKVEGEWRAFERTALRTAFQAYEWISSWQVHIGARRGTIPVVVTGRDETGTLLFILPLAVENHWLGRRLTWLASELCDYNAPLLAPGFALSDRDWIATWRKITAQICTDPRLAFVVADLKKMPGTIGGRPNPMITLGVDHHPADAHVATLGSDWTEYYKSKRSSSSRKAQRKNLNRLADYGPLSFVEAREAGDITRTLATLMSQKRRTLARRGLGDMFEQPGVREFFAAVCRPRPGARDVHVSRLDVGEVVGAAGVGLMHGSRFYLILSSYNDGPMADHGPGRAHLLQLMQMATEMGFREFDFTFGNEAYKFDWADIRVPLFDHISAAGIRGAAVKAAIVLWRATKRAIKNNPAIWRAFEHLARSIPSLGKGR